MKTYLKKNGMSRVIIVGKHPLKDFVAICNPSGEGLNWVAFSWFFENFEEEK